MDKKEKEALEETYGPLDCYRLAKVDGRYTLLYADSFTFKWMESEAEYWPQTPEEIPETQTIDALRKKLQLMLEALDKPELDIGEISWRYEGCRE